MDGAKNDARICHIRDDLDRVKGNARGDEMFWPADRARWIAGDHLAHDEPVKELAQGGQLCIFFAKRKARGYGVLARRKPRS